MSVAMASNLGRILRQLIGAGKPRYLAALAARHCFAYMLMERIIQRIFGAMINFQACQTKLRTTFPIYAAIAA